MPKAAKAQMFSLPVLLRLSEWCVVNIAALTGSALFASEMDDNLRNETHHRIRVPDCMGLMRAYDKLVIEMIAKPALP